MTPSQKSNPLCTHGMVTTPHHLASQAGLDILRRGGSAVDAAIAASATLAVVYPHMCGLGGDAFWLIHNAGQTRMLGLNASGRAGRSASIDLYRSRGLTRIPSRGPLAANTVPGVVSGWEAAFAHSTAEMNSPLQWRDLLGTALDLAREGFPVSTSLAHWTRVNAGLAAGDDRDIHNFPAFADIFLRDGQARPVGDILRLPELAATLEALALHGPREFYQGSIAQKITADLLAQGGVLTQEDFAAHTADWVEPLCVKYRGFEAWNLPPNCQGMASLAILNILNNFNVKALGDGSADYCHLLVEATRQAFADRNRYLTDPAFAPIPLADLLSPEHGQTQAARICMDKAAPAEALLAPKGDTVWLGAVDAAGNAASVIQSIYFDFGSGLAPGGTGVLLQNRGCYFSLKPEHVNCLAPGKRSAHTLNPAMLSKNGVLRLVYGSMGGEGQPQTQAALVTRLVDFGQSPQEAIDRPRWLYGSTWGAPSNALHLESRFAEETVAELKRRGLPVRVVEPYTDMMGHAGAILLDQESGLRQAGADPRGDGSAVGY